MKAIRLVFDSRPRVWVVAAGSLSCDTLINRSSLTHRQVFRTGGWCRGLCDSCLGYLSKEEVVYLMTHILFKRVQGVRHMVKDHSESERGTRCRHYMGYSFRLTTRVLLYASPSPLYLWVRCPHGGMVISDRLPLINNSTLIGYIGIGGMGKNYK